MLCAIHQPNFFPWMGYFDKIRRADIFVFLDDVAYPRSGSGSMGSWVNRVKIASKNEPKWIGCPIRRMPLGFSINRAVVDDEQPWRVKLIKTLASNYGRSENYSVVAPMIAKLVQNGTENLAEFNIACIKAISSELGISATFIKQSEIFAKGKATDLLVDIVRSVGANAYLAGGGAQSYQEDDKFFSNGIDLVYQKFVQKPYVDEDSFIPGLSVIDYLMRGKSGSFGNLYGVDDE